MIPKKVLEELDRWIDQKKFGNIQINFSGGKIANINRNESVKVDDLAPLLTSSSNIKSEPPKA